MIRVLAVIRTAIVVVAVLAGPPAVMLAVGGAPWPARTVTAEQVQQWLDAPLNAEHAGTTGWVIAWIGWALTASIVLALGVTRACSRDWRRSWERICYFLPGPMQGLAATLLGTATVATAGGAMPAHAAAPAVAAADGHPGAADLTASGHHPATGSAALSSGAGAVPAAHGQAADPRHVQTVTVHRGDTLWDIADDKLGDPYRWKEIYRLNRARYDMHGGDLIRPAWKLVLPGATAKPAPALPATPATPPPATSSPSDRGSSASTPAPGAPASQPAAPAASAGAATTVSAAADPDDGAIDPADDTPAPPGTSHPDSPQADGSAAAGRAAPAGVSLSSGSWLDVGLAGAVAAAATLLWAHRRRRYRRRPAGVELRLQDPDLAPLPPVVTEIRRSLRTHPHPAASAPPPQPATPQASAATIEDVQVSASAQGEDRGSGLADARQPVRPVAPALTNPVAALWPSSGLGLVGPGAAAAARGLLAAALADRSPDEPHSQVVLPSATATALFGAAMGELPDTPQLTVTTDLAAALDLLEEQILYRSRLVYAHRVDTVAAMRAADPVEEPTPPIMLLADATGRHEQTRIAALLAQGERLGIHGVLLGAWPDGTTVAVAGDGTTTPGDGSRHGRHPADIGRLAVLTGAETIAVISTLAEAHTGRAQPQPAAGTVPAAAAATAVREDDAILALSALAQLGDATAAAVAGHTGMPYPATTAKLVHWEHTGHTRTVRADNGQTLWQLTDAGRTFLCLTTGGAGQSDPATQAELPTPAPTDPLTAPIPVDQDDPESNEPMAQPTADDQDQHGDAIAEHSGERVEVAVLGTPRIVAEELDRLPRRKALELLVYLAVHDGSATTEQILDDLLPDAPASKAPQRLHTYVSDIRNVMRRIAGPGTYLTHPQHRYVLNQSLIDVDLWRMRSAIREANHATDRRERIAGLRRAVDAYRGPFADGVDYEWAEPYREAIRQQALDAHLTLADALADQPEAQVQVLEAAIGHSPHSEELYRYAMRARAALGHVDAILSLRRAAGRAMAQIDAEVSDETIALSDQLIAGLQRHGQQAPSHSAASA
ncbi:hypothetical protein GCM10023107_35540 [Actinoplanes octamycinicus]|nr:bacterial transcriptional activator domain-containing protein [Actinoplanes octamycinicus]GIE57473.1 hypothetical protein Aoc01nite_28750 [Actinoplanes octamycinicus]